MIKSALIVAAMLFTGAASGLAIRSTAASAPLPAAGCACASCESGCDCCKGEDCTCQDCGCIFCDC